jgi:hypothetical protein
MLKLMFAITINWLLINTALAQNNVATGVIHGTVINEVGQNVAGAKIRVHNTSDHRIRVAPIRYVESDNDGKFTMDHLEWGSYRVYAMKETEAYPDSGVSVYSNGLAATANLSTQTPSATVVVTLGPKAGKISGAISDSVTGKPIPNASIRIWRWDNENNFLQRSTQSNYDILVPANVQVGIEIRAPGYEAWRYPGVSASLGGQPLSLKPEEVLNEAVQLQPKTN